jgi:FAD synthetase
MKILVFGTFDTLHAGHRFVLDQSSKRGDLYVIVARDTTVEKIKMHVPRESEEKRKKVIEAVYPEATVILGDSEEYLVPVRSVQPDLILLGYDQKLPPGVEEKDLPCAVERLEAFYPERYKSSIGT